MDDTYPDPPEHPSERAAELWRAIVGNRAKNPERIALLRAGLEATDRADQAAAILNRKGLITGSTSGKMQHSTRPYGSRRTRVPSSGVSGGD